MNVIDGLARQSLVECMETLSQRFKLDPDQLRHRFGAAYRSVDPARQIPFPGVCAVCERIHQRGGLNVIVTHRDIQSTRGLLAAHQLGSFLDDIFSIEQGYSRKPNPAMVLAAIENTEWTLAKPLIGDRDLDIQAGGQPRCTPACLERGTDDSRGISD